MSAAHGWTADPDTVGFWRHRAGYTAQVLATDDADFEMWATADADFDDVLADAAGFAEARTLADRVAEVSEGNEMTCPVCIARSPHHTEGCSLARLLALLSQEVGL